MNHELSLDELVSQAAEALYEDEAIRSKLADREASFLLSWAQGQLEIFARSLVSRQGDADPADLFNAHARRVRRAARGINALVGDRDALTDEEFSEELNSLLSSAGAPRAMPQAAELVAQRREMDPLALVARLASLTTESWQIRGGSRPSASLPPVDSGRPLFQFGLPLLVLALVLIAAAVTAFFILRPSQGAGPSAPIPQGTGWYQVHFTAPLYPDDPSRHQGSLDERLTAFINTATSTVDMAIYELDLANVTNALLEAKNRGATVRVVTSTETMEDARESRSFKQLQSAGIQVVAGNPNAIMHDKFVVVDGAAVWTGSWNFTDNDSYRYNNNGVLLQSQELARNYTVAFEKMWRDKQFGRQKKPGGTTPKLTINGVTVESYFSPEDGVADKVAARLRSAQKSIDFMAFSFTEDQIGSVVRDRAKAGVKVRGVFERTGSETQFSEFGKMRSDGLEVLQDGNPYLMHHKVFVIDGRTVITGSFNFSANANTSNDENLLMVDDPAMAGPFTAEFERVLAQAKNPPTK